MTLKIRDFIYMDVERLKSIISQIEQGLVSELSETAGDSKEATLEAEGGLAGVLKAAGGTTFLWQRQQTETKTLHDYIYNRVEDTLLHRKSLTRIPGDISLSEIESGRYTTTLSDTSFILAAGKININDFGNMRVYLENFNDLAKFLSRTSGQSLPENTPKSQKTQHIKQLEQKMTIDDATIKGFKLIFNMFYKDRIVVKMRPFDDYPDFRLVGNLDKDFLRDDIASIIYKYGTAPLSKWGMLAQIASMPPENREKEIQSAKGSKIELALQRLFDTYREIELLAQSVVYPEIAVTPIAIYRQ